MFKAKGKQKKGVLHGDMPFPLVSANTLTIVNTERPLRFPIISNELHNNMNYLF